VGTGHHRIDKTFTTSKRGSQTVWVYVINTGSGSNVLLECKDDHGHVAWTMGLASAIRADPNSIAASFAALFPPRLVRRVDHTTGRVPHVAVIAG
jgi:hypothetical protein